MKKQVILSHLAVAGAITLTLLSPAQAATIQVQANSNYFSGWQFNTLTSPSTGCGSEDTPSSSTFSGTFAGSNFTVTTASAPAPQQWQNCPAISPGSYPSNSGRPNTVGAVNIRSGDMRYTFSQALPTGATIFVQDLDNAESASFTFLSCSNQAIDASNFDLLRVSTPSSTTPAASPGASWSATSANVNSPNEVFGIIIRSQDVCSIRIVGTAATSSGGETFYFGAPPPSAAASSATPVPTLNQWGLLALTAVIALAGVYLRTRRSM